MLGIKIEVKSIGNVVSAFLSISNAPGKFVFTSPKLSKRLEKIEFARDHMIGSISLGINFEAGICSWAGYNPVTNAYREIGGFSKFGIGTVAERLVLIEAKKMCPNLSMIYHLKPSPERITQLLSRGLTIEEIENGYSYKRAISTLRHKIATNKVKEIKRKRRVQRVRSVFGMFKRRTAK